jgi:hypothetical protein
MDPAVGLEVLEPLLPTGIHGSPEAIPNLRGEEGREAG